MLEELLGQKAMVDRLPVHPTDVPATWADIAKAQMLLGWQPGVDLEGSLRKTVAWYRENREWARDVAVEAL